MYKIFKSGGNIMYGEPQKENDLFFTCSLIEAIARETKNTKKVVIEKLGKQRIQCAKLLGHWKSLPKINFNGK